MKHVYCSKCGTKLGITRKAIPSYGQIVDLIPPHECSEEVQELDMEKLSVPAFQVNVEDVENKFVQKLNDLSHVKDSRPPEYVRKEVDPKSSAPPGLLQSLRPQGIQTGRSILKDDPRERSLEGEQEPDDE